MGSLTILLMNKLNTQLKMLANKINTATLHPKTSIIKLFYHNQKHDKLNENILKMLIQKHLLPTDPNKN